MPPQTPIVLRTLGDFLAYPGHTLSAHCPACQHSEPLDVRRLVGRRYRAARAGAAAALPAVRSQGRRYHHLNSRAERVTIYRLRSFTPSSRIIAVQRFSAADDAEALSMACTMVKGAEAVAWFDLWEGKHLIHCTAPANGKPRQ